MDTQKFSEAVSIFRNWKYNSDYNFCRHNIEEWLVENGLWYTYHQELSRIYGCPLLTTVVQRIEVAIQVVQERSDPNFFRNDIPEEYLEDCKRIQKICSDKNIFISLEDALHLWNTYSEDYAAGWMGMPSDDYYVFQCIHKYILNNV